jgi:stage II sporulation protein D
LFDPKYGIPLTNIRNAFQLKSTFFNVHKEGGFIVLKGKGFGHGVGLCQQGAMKMSRMGYDATSILKYYFPQAEIHIQ